MKYYHITPVENAESILKNGLIANECGEIFIFQFARIKQNGIVNSIDDCIAYHQLGLDRYARIEINPVGIFTELVQDMVDESTYLAQWIVNQDRIDPKHLRLDLIKNTEYVSPWL
jgi:hypothetical protein